MGGDAGMNHGVRRDLRGTFENGRCQLSTGLSLRCDRSGLETNGRRVSDGPFGLDWMRAIVTDLARITFRLLLSIQHQRLS